MEITIQHCVLHTVRIVHLQAGIPWTRVHLVASHYSDASDHTQYTAKKDFLFWQLYFSPELQLYGMILIVLVTATYEQYSAATGKNEYATRAGKFYYGLDVT